MKVSGSLEFDSVEFFISQDPGLVAGTNLIMSLYQGFGGGLASNTKLTESTITSISGNAPTLIRFTAPITLGAGDYSIQFTSNATAANKSYDIRKGSLIIFDVDGQNRTALPPSSYESVNDGTAVIPEPSTAIMGLLAPALLLMRRRRA